MPTIGILSEDFVQECFTKKDSSCVVPWVHAHLDASGIRRLCCISKYAPPEVARAPFEVFWNSGYMKSIRKQMMNGSLPDDCAHCKKPNKMVTYKSGLNERFTSSFVSIVRDTQLDGSTPPRIRFLDYRSHGCNLSCKTCGPEASSAWLQQLERRADIWENIVSHKYCQALKSTVRISHYDTEVRKLANDPAIEEIYFAGGEPLISSKHHEILEDLIQSGTANKVRLVYNTNLNLPPPIIEKWIAKLKFFRKITIFASIDGTRKLTEYIRTGMSFDRFHENLQRLKALKSSMDNMDLMLDVTITSLFLLELKEFAQYAIREKVDVVSKLMFFNGHKSDFLRCEILPRKIRERLSQDWRTFYSQLSPDEASLLKDLDANLGLVVFAESLSQSDSKSRSSSSSERFGFSSSA